MRLETYEKVDGLKINGSFESFVIMKIITIIIIKWTIFVKIKDVK